MVVYPWGGAKALREKHTVVFARGRFSSKWRNITISDDAEIIAAGTCTGYPPKAKAYNVFR